MVQKIGATVLLSLSLLLLFAQPGFSGQDAVQNEADAALKLLMDQTISYFNPVAGKVVSVKGNVVKIEPGSQESVKKGMRFAAFKEGATFIHPVTKEPLGKIELPLGAVEVTSVTERGASAVILKGDPAHFADARLKIPATKVRMLFYQGDIDWSFGDAYYQMLKESHRFELIDTDNETTDIAKILADAKTKGADAALVLTSETSAGEVTFKQKLFWVADSKEFAAKEVKADVSSVKDLRLRSGLFIPREGEILVSFHLPFKADRLATGDLAGNGDMEIALAYGNEIRIYRQGVDLKALEEFSVPANEIIWMDTLDINKDGKDEILITALRGDEVVSFIYEFKDSSYVPLFKIKDKFLRKIGNQAIAQDFSKGDGYDGPVYFFNLKGNTFQKGKILKLPDGVNIYDFQLFKSPEGKQSVAAWDEKGFLHIYNSDGIRLWVGKEDFGGFSTTFDKAGTDMVVDRGKWSVKDRLLISNNELLAPKRQPLFGMARGLGYWGSSIKGLWWNGSTIEERNFLENAGGDLLDYDVVGDRLIVLSGSTISSGVMKVFKGENPFGSSLYIYSLKGR
ncbi:MAG: FG-GAP repeat domain-containing protein [Dissulfurispiraceae bacterium]